MPLNKFIFNYNFYSVYVWLLKLDLKLDKSNLASIRPLHKKPCLVLKSILVYIEVPMCLPPTMMATAAEGICPNSTYHLENLPLTQANIKVMEVEVGFNSNTSPLIETSCSTLCNVQSCVADPMHAANFCSNHDQWQPIDLVAICYKIKCSTTTLDALFATLVCTSNSDKEHHHNANSMHADAPPSNHQVQWQPVDLATIHSMIKSSSAQMHFFCENSLNSKHNHTSLWQPTQMHLIQHQKCQMSAKIGKIMWSFFEGICQRYQCRNALVDD